MWFKCDDLQKSTFLVIVFHYASNNDPDKNCCNRLRKNLQSMNSVVGVQKEDAQKGNEEKENYTHLHILFLMMMLLNVFDIFTIMLRI